MSDPPTRFPDAPLRWLVLGFGLTALAACSSLQALNPWHSNNALEYISFSVDANANNGVAFDIHLVFFMDADLATSFSSMTANTYFKAYREQRLENNPKLGIVAFESRAEVPSVVHYEVPSRFEEAWAVVVYASYLDVDLDGVPVGDYEKVRLEFTDVDITPVVAKED